ncbi:SDR family oxidoreductase [Rapidithrix thailandica]|uniref:SDR family oxidoreductase n=1 Tax=Rapidithrix thailandica TaxID=413964 RepID=A0AAW9SFH9_9BACT
MKKVALITGGSRGLGRNTAIALSKKETDIIITYNTQKEKAEEVIAEVEKNGGKAVALQLNLGEVKSLSKFVEKLSGILLTHWERTHFDFLVNNAGFGIYSPITQTSEEQFDSLMNVHLKGVFFLTQKLLPFLADNGAIVNFSTGLARFSVPGYAAYASMKGAVEVFTKYLAKELGARGIRVNVIAPGAIDNDFNKSNFEKHPEAKEFLASQTALGRVGRSEDIGSVVAAICSDALGWVNGQRIEASGGMFL